MKSNPLRGEFVLTGLAFMFAAFWLVDSINQRFRGGDVHVLRFLHNNDVKDYAVLALGVAIGAAYLVGVVIVQLTFWRPTLPLIENIREARFRELRGLGARINKATGPKGKYHVILDMAFAPWDYKLDPLVRTSMRRRGLRRVIPLRLTSDQAQLRHAETLTLTIGRSLANAELAQEYQYRRANRQIFVGVLPSVVIGCLGIEIRWCSGIWCVAAAIAAAPVLLVLWRSARYQEKVGQALLLDMAFLHLWASAVDLLPPSRGT